MKELLEKTRKISKMIQNSDNISYKQMTEVLHDIISVNVFIFSCKGELLGHTITDTAACDVLENCLRNNTSLTDAARQRLIAIRETIANAHLTDGLCMMRSEVTCPKKDKCYTIIPIYGNAECLGALLLTRMGKVLNDGDLLLGEYAATCIGVQMLHNKSLEIEVAAQKRAMVKIAYSNLSYSETEAIRAILNELEGLEGLLVASKIADRAGITRSVIVNALRKFESAGVLRTQSLGMKGTHVKILNEYLKEVVPES